MWWYLFVLLEIGAFAWCHMRKKENDGNEGVSRKMSKVHSIDRVNGERRIPSFSFIHFFKQLKITSFSFIPWGNSSTRICNVKLRAMLQTHVDAHTHTHSEKSKHIELVFKLVSFGGSDYRQWYLSIQVKFISLKPFVWWTMSSAPLST